MVLGGGVVGTDVSGFNRYGSVGGSGVRGLNRYVSDGGVL
jgi:hypothetical protein